MNTQCNFRVWKPAILFEEIFQHVQFTEREHIVLELLTLGVPEQRVMWLMGLQLSELRQITEGLEAKLGTDDLPVAGALLRDREILNPIAIGARLAETKLRVLTGAQILVPVVEGDHCGLRVILADGTPMNVWVYAAEDIDWPGDIRLEWAEAAELVAYDEIEPLLASLHQALNTNCTTADLLRRLLGNFIERALGILDDMEGDCDLEHGPDHEPETDEWLNPVSLNPAYQNEPIILSAAL